MLILLSGVDVSMHIRHTQARGSEGIVAISNGTRLTACSVLDEVHSCVPDESTRRPVGSKATFALSFDSPYHTLLDFTLKTRGLLGGKDAAWYGCASRIQLHSRLIRCPAIETAVFQKEERTVSCRRLVQHRLREAFDKRRRIRDQD